MANGWRQPESIRKRLASRRRVMRFNGRLLLYFSPLLLFMFLFHPRATWYENALGLIVMAGWVLVALWLIRSGKRSD